jgi:uncharacterized protein HemY
LLLVGVVAWALGFRWPGASDSLGQIALGSLGLSAALGAISTLLPYRTRGHASDGLGMVGSFFTSEDSFARRLAWPQWSEARRLLLREQIGAAEQCVKRGMERFANEPRLCGLAAVCEAAAGRPSEAYAALEALGPPEKREPAERAELLIDAAWSVLLAADHELYSEAQRALQTALELVGDDPHALVLLGRTHLEQGRPEQAYTYLMAAYKRVRDVDQEAQCVAYLAIACAELRDSPAAARIAGYAPRFFHAARSHQVPPALLERVQRAESRR